MAGIMSKLLAGGLGSMVKDIGGVIDKFHTSDDEKLEARRKVMLIAQARSSEIEQTIRTELTAKASIIQSEMASGDNYTKRARPSLAYFGMAVIAFNYCLVPFVGAFLTFFGSEFVMPVFDLPTEFWVAWGGVVATWSVGRSAEKRGKSNAFAKLAAGDPMAEANKIIDGLI